MKTLLLWIVLLGISFTSFGQTTDTKNWIKTITYKQSFNSETSLPTNPTPQQGVVQIGYFDGLGRPIQTIAHAQAANGNDIVTPIVYDGYGRQTKEYLPYVPSSTTELGFYDGADDAVVSYYSDLFGLAGNNPYSETKFENSPLNRVLKQAAPGEDWKMDSRHEIKYGYATNKTNEVIAYKVNTTWNNLTKIYDIELINDTQYYNANQLYKNITKDENHSKYDSEKVEEFTDENEKVEEFTDKNGKVVLIRTWVIINPEFNRDPNTPHDTYYVYDDFGNLTYVLPPAVAYGVEISQTTLDALCYQYKYDQRNRLVAKKLPGKQWEYIVYDRLDRIRAIGPVLSPFTNSNQNTKGWLFTKYDQFNRPIMTSWVEASTIDETTRLSIQDSVYFLPQNETKSNSNMTILGVVFRYTNSSYPNSGYNILTVNYYDDYLYPNAPTDFSNVLNQPLKTNVKGMPTGSWVRVLEALNNYNGNVSYVLYKNDRMSSPIKSRTQYYTLGYTQTEIKVNFVGEVEQNVTKHKKTSSSTEMVITEVFTYSDQGRMETHTHQVNSEAVEFLSVNTYDDLGQLISKEVGGNGINPLQTVDYAYNIRGWLTDINDVTQLGNDLFAFGIKYQNPLHENSIPLYNGNISETYWKSSTDQLKRMYYYQYDGLNRLKKASYENTDVINTVGNYNEVLEYDKNGNIQYLNRNGFEESSTFVTPIDQLKYYYDQNNKNLLLKVVDLTNSTEGFKDDVISNDNSAMYYNDLTDDYKYDTYGNMIFDENKKITNIKYNHMNLPTQIQIQGQGVINYTYDATGKKIKKHVQNTASTSYSTTEYIDGFQYNNDVLQFFPTSEGYVNHILNNGISYFGYVYNYTDHLGNIRLSYTWDEDIQDVSILEEHHYYPFGLEHKYYNSTRKTIEISQIPLAGSLIGRPRIVQVPNSGYQYQYNGKEWQDELGLNMTAMDFRQYDNAIGRFVGMDRLSEMAYDITPYRFALNNPVYFGDPTGLIEMHVLDKMFDYSISGENWYNDNTEGFYSDHDGYVSYDGSYSKRPDYSSDTTYLPPVYVTTYDYNSYKRAAKEIEENIYQTKWYDESGHWGEFSSNSVSTTGVLLQIGDNVSTLYKHKTYRQTNGKIVPIRKTPKGPLKTSKQAQRAIRGSRFLKLVSFVSNGLMTYNGVVNYSENGFTLRNTSDMVIGTLGTIAAGIVLFSNPVGWVATACIIVGTGSAIYGTATTGYDIYEEIKGD